MKATALKTMQAAAIDRFGGVEEISLKTLPVPEIDADEVLIRVQSAGVGAWDPYQREGHFDEAFGVISTFPHILGSEGAGTVEAVGEKVTSFREGDRVYSMSLMNPKGGFYAQYVAVKAEHVWRIPGKLSIEQAGVMPVDAVTAMIGLDETLGLKGGETVMILGASGGIGHLAVQIARQMGAGVLAVASGDDGVALARSLGADLAINGRKEDLVEAARQFAPGGLDAVLLTAGGEAAEKSLTTLRDGGRVAYPNGVSPVPRPRAGLIIQSYDGVPNPQVMERLNRLIEFGQLEVHVARVFPLEQAAEAHRALNTHFLGKLALRP